MLLAKKWPEMVQQLPHFCTLHLSFPIRKVVLFNLYWDNKQQSQAQSDWCKMQMVFRAARWRCEFLGTTWLNKSDANLPGGDTKPPDNPWTLLFSSSILWVCIPTLKTGRAKRSQSYTQSFWYWKVKDFFFFTCKLLDYVAHEMTTDFWKNIHFSLPWIIIFSNKLSLFHTEVSFDTQKEKQSYLKLIFFKILFVISWATWLSKMQDKIPIKYFWTFNH